MSNANTAGGLLALMWVEDRVGWDGGWVVCDASRSTGFRNSDTDFEDSATNIIQLFVRCVYLDLNRRFGALLIADVIVQEKSNLELQRLLLSKNIVKKETDMGGSTAYVTFETATAEMSTKVEEAVSALELHDLQLALS